MTLEGAINFNETQDYIIYTMNSVTTGQYSFVMPKNITGTLNMLVDLHMKSSFDGVSSGAKTKEQLISEISEEYNKVKTKYTDGMLVMPMIDETMYQNAVNNADKQKMFDEVKKIGAITSELYKKLTDSGIEKQKIDQKIIIVEKNSDDEKFVLWLKEQMPNFVDGILYSDFTSIQSSVNPFDNNNIFGPAVVESVVPNNSSLSGSGSVFDTPTATSTVESVSSVESINTSLNVPDNNSLNEPVINNMNIFGEPTTAQNAVETPPVVNNNTSVTENNTPQNIAVTPAATVEAPKPVESSPLEGTTTFSAVTDQNISTETVEKTSVEEGNDTGSTVEHASKGFANLLILLIILVGVTFASIELGKFLYSVYGA